MRKHLRWILTVLAAAIFAYVFWHIEQSRPETRLERGDFRYR